MATLQRKSRPNGHSHETDATPGEAQCPYCGQPISRKEFNEIRAKVETEERARMANVEHTLTARFARERGAVELQAKAAIEKAKQDAVKVAEATVKAIRQKQEATIAGRLMTQRETLEKKQAEAVNAEKLKHHAEKLKLEEQLQDMQRRLQAKTAHQIGEPAEVDLFDALVGAFPHDRISRVRKGVRGPDVLIEVIHQDTVVGKIALDSKAHARWSNKFTTKLRSDQITATADFGVLVSAVFPANARELHLQDNVVVVSPARAVVLVQLLRRHIIETHRLRITGRARNQKAEALLAYVVSPEANDLMERLRRAADDMIDLEVKEVDAHHTVWRRRGEMIRMVQKNHEDLTAAIEAILGETASEAEAAE